MHLTVNAVIRINHSYYDGIYRVVALPSGSHFVFLFRLSNESQGTEPNEETPDTRAERLRPPTRTIRLSRDTIASLVSQDALHEVAFQVDPKYRLGITGLTNKEKKIYENRCRVATPFLDHERVCDALLSSRGIGQLVAEIRSSCPSSRSSCYRLWESLCRHGFHLSSLNPRFDRCGAPEKLRPWVEGKPKAGRKSLKERLGIAEPHPQIGVTAEMRKKIVSTFKALKNNAKLTYRTIYLKIIDNCFSRSYKETEDGIKAQPLVQGTYPTEQQVLRIIQQENNRLVRKQARTTVGYFNRNHRGLIGKSWEGIAGPGHVYAIDSTVGDIYLRSRVNRAWSIGRPIVYIVVDVWSTAIVGFHICLSGPSWETAKIALLSTAPNVPSVAEMWGHQETPHLTPRPSLPHAFLCDRGEYLSKGAKTTGERLGVNMQYNPSYRPDLKGIVEVLHRITKDEQFQFIPGAMDARRKEIEIRANPRDSIFTIDEYVCYLNDIFAHYNFFSDRTHRLTTDMISADVDPSPAGLWGFGHQVGIGYQKHHQNSQLILDLLPSQNAVIRKDGVYLGEQKYSSPVVEEKNWAALARNFGVMEQTMHYFPENNSEIWWNNPDTYELETFTLSPTSPAAPGVSFDEFSDAWMYEKTKKSNTTHARTINALETHDRTQALVASAKEKTAQADRNYEGPIPNLRHAKSFEVNSSQKEPTPPSTPEPNLTTSSHANDAAYDAAMEELFSTRSENEVSS